MSFPEHLELNNITFIWHYIKVQKQVSYEKLTQITIVSLISIFFNFLIAALFTLTNENNKTISISKFLTCSIIDKGDNKDTFSDYLTLVVGLHFYINKIYKSCLPASYTIAYYILYFNPFFENSPKNAYLCKSLYFR